jgi:ubiquinone/menaquinone biosynthesis C-methylase UbiE
MVVRPGGPGRSTAVTTTALAEAYSSVAQAWTAGPTRIYGRLAEALVASSPVPMRGADVVDLGSGTGLGSHAASAAGARVVAVDLALGMLRLDRDRRPPAVAADLLALPFADHTFDIALAPFSLNHLSDPAAGVAEAARIIHPTGVLLASTYAVGDDHPVRQAVDQALTEFGWRPPTWYVEVKRAMTAWGTVDLVAATVESGGMTPVFVEHREVAFPELDASDVVGWRLGMAHTAPFVALLDERRRVALVERARSLLGDVPSTLVRQVIVFAAA